MDQRSVNLVHQKESCRRYEQNYPSSRHLVTCLVSLWGASMARMPVGEYRDPEGPKTLVMWDHRKRTPCRRYEIEIRFISSIQKFAHDYLKAFVFNYAIIFIGYIQDIIVFMMIHPYSTIVNYFDSSFGKFFTWLISYSEFKPIIWCHFNSYT